MIRFALVVVALLIFAALTLGIAIALGLLALVVVWVLAWLVFVDSPGGTLVLNTLLGLLLVAGAALVAIGVLS